MRPQGTETRRQARSPVSRGPLQEKERCRCLACSASRCSIHSSRSRRSRSCSSYVCARISSSWARRIEPGVRTCRELAYFPCCRAVSTLWVCTVADTEPIRTPMPPPRATDLDQCPWIEVFPVPVLKEDAVLLVSKMHLPAANLLALGQVESCSKGITCKQGVTHV